MGVLTHPLFGIGAAAVSAALLFAAGEPLGWGPLAWVALVPLLVGILRSPRSLWSWIYGLVFALLYFGAHLSWIFLFGWMAWTALVVVLALYTSASALLSGFVRNFQLAPLFVAGAWSGVELARDRWPFGGYSWGSIGTTQGSVPGVRWVAGSIGVYGLTFIVVFFAALIAYRIACDRWAWVSVGVVGVVLAVFIGIDAFVVGSPEAGEPLRVGVVQGGVPRPPQPDQRDLILASHIGLTERIARGQDLDLIVWPEDAIGIDVSNGADAEVADLARDLDTPLIVGRSVADSRDESFLNLVEHIDSDGRTVAAYQKRHPVPFGEYVPLSFLRGFVGTLRSEVPFDLAAGDAPRVFDVETRAGPVRVATPICFESVFPRDILDFTRLGADLYVVSTNNASFERSYASQQHLAHARMRALETRQWIVQAALAGISGVLHPDGKITQTTELFAADAFTADVRTRPASSLYAEVGDLFPALFATAILIALGVHVATRRRAHTRES